MPESFINLLREVSNFSPALVRYPSIQMAVNRQMCVCKSRWSWTDFVRNILTLLSICPPWFGRISKQDFIDIFQFVIGDIADF